MIMRRQVCSQRVGFAKGAGKLGWGCRDLTAHSSIASVGAVATPPIPRASGCPEHIIGPSCEQQVSSHVFRRDELKPSSELARRLIANGCIKRMEICLTASISKLPTEENSAPWIHLVTPSPLNRVIDCSRKPYMISTSHFQRTSCPRACS
jgi:hypothetical protein